MALRVAVAGGAWSGFNYDMAIENSENPTDNVYEFDGLKVLVDQISGGIRKVSLSTILRR